MPTYFVASSSFPTEQFVDATTMRIAAEKAGRFVARGLEGDSESTFPVFIMQVGAPPEQWDVHATATVDRTVTVTKHE